MNQNQNQNQSQNQSQNPKPNQRPYMSSAIELAEEVRTGRRTARSVVEATLADIEARDSDIHAFIHLMNEKALASADSIDKAVEQGLDPGPLAGVPIALKDNLCTKGTRTTCGSAMLEHWCPPYDATVVTRIQKAGAILIGKANMDEFAMGSSTENSYFGPTKNPHNLERVPGGSSGGSAAAVAAGFVPLALGSDTGGSIRQPGAFCGVVGIKPTYGAVSRYGLIAFASSLDQIGTFASSVADAVELLDVISGHDLADSTSLVDFGPDSLQGSGLQSNTKAIKETLGDGVNGLRIGLCKELIENVDPDVASRVLEATDALADAGAVIKEVSIPELNLGLSAYYLIAPAEASSNLARYDGVRYGLRVEALDVEAMNIATRTTGFGNEVKRRIMLGTYALSAGYYDAYYAQALKVRTLLIEAFGRAYAEVDVLLGATAPTTAFALGDKVDNPIQMYLSDVCTIPSNLAGHPAMSVPFGTGDDGLPVGVQVLAPARGESVMCRVAAVMESAAANMHTKEAV